MYNFIHFNQHFPLESYCCFMTQKKSHNFIAQLKMLLTFRLKLELYVLPPSAYIIVILLLL